MTDSEDEEEEEDSEKERERKRMKKGSRVTRTRRSGGVMTRSSSRNMLTRAGKEKEEEVKKEEVGVKKQEEVDQVPVLPVHKVKGDRGSFVRL